MAINYSIYHTETASPAGRPLPFNELEIPIEVRRDIARLLDWFTPNIYVCGIAVGLNVVVFLAMLAFGFNPAKVSMQELLDWGANYGPLTITQGQWWRLLSSMFVHTGFAHLAFNMFALVQVGRFMERFLGNFAFAVVYLICGLAGSLVSLAWNPYIASAGASGAIFGLYGALLGFLVLRADSIPKPALINQLIGSGVFIAVNMVYGFLNPHIDFGAHLGGLASGVLCGLVMSNPIQDGFKRRRVVRAAILAAASLPSLLTFALLLPRPLDFFEEIRAVEVLDTKAHAGLGAMIGQVRAGHVKDTNLANQIQTDMIRPWHAERLRLASFTRVRGLQARTREIVLEYMASYEQSWADLGRGLQSHDLSVVQQSNREREQAQSKLRESMESLRASSAY